MAYITLARNVGVDTEGSTHSGHIGLFVLRELYLLGYWQELEKSADAAWTSVNNVLAEPTDLEVAAADELIITSPTAPFTQAMEDQFISLYASNNDNRGLYRIKRFVSSSKIILEPMCRPTPWVDETGISAKIHNAGKSDYLIDGSYFVMRAPSATGRPTEVYATAASGRWIELYGYPLGDWFDPPGVPSTPGARTATAGTGAQIAYSSVRSYFNAYITDPSGAGLLHHVQIGSDMWVRLVTGELEDVDTGDDSPGFVNSTDDNAGREYPDSDLGARLHMLNDTDSQMYYWATYLARAYNDDSAAGNPHRLQYNIVMKGKAPFFKPLVLANSEAAGGYIRGRLPYYVCNPYQPKLFPIDPDYFHIRNGVVIPRMGSADKVLRGLK